MSFTFTGGPQLKCPECEYAASYWQNDVWIQQFMSENPGTDLCCPNCNQIFPVPIEEPLMPPTTQKAKGIYALMKVSFPGEIIRVPVRFLGKVSEEWNLPEIVKATLTQGGSLFARPCPPNPEHGFVESRVVKSIEEIEQVKQETLAANPDSEVILMNPIEAVRNQVWTPTLLVIGPGHDGATLGKNIISIPLAGLNPLKPELIQEAGLAPGADPYIEAVQTKENQTYLTQLRGGPPLPAGIGPDFIPQDITVNEIIKTNGEDLLTWAKKVRSLKGKTDVIVWHPGGALTDHYSVHCRENNVPIVTTFQPVEGLMLEAANFIQMGKIDPHEVALGLAVGDHLKFPTGVGYYEQAPFVRLCLLALHNSSVMREKHSFWVGVAVSILIKLGCSALEAEARHAHSCYKGMKGKPDIYGFYSNKSITFLRARLSRVTQLLHYGFGDVNLKHGYGGPKWALCGAALAPLFTSARKVILEESEEAASDLIQALNIAINQAHNGGWWLNKFIAASEYTWAWQGQICIPIMASSTIEQAHKLRPHGEGYLVKLKKQASTWPIITSIRNLKWRKVSLDVSAGSFGLTLKAATVPIPISVVLPSTPSILKSMVSGKGTLLIENGQVLLKVTDEETLSIWKEHPLVVESHYETN